MNRLRRILGEGNDGERRHSLIAVHSNQRLRRFLMVEQPESLKGLGFSPATVDILVQISLRESEWKTR